jgi:hypothetical protein
LAEVEHRFKRVFPAGHKQIATLTTEQALLAQARGEMDMAATLADRAVAMTEANPHAGDLLGRLLVSRSAFALQMRRLEAATSDATRALALEIDRTDPGCRSSNIGRAYLALGAALSAQRKPDDATGALASALQHLEPTLNEDHPDTRRARQLLNSLHDGTFRPHE